MGYIDSKITKLVTEAMQAAKQKSDEVLRRLGPKEIVDLIPLNAFQRIGLWFEEVSPKEQKAFALGLLAAGYGEFYGTSQTNSALGQHGGEPKDRQGCALSSDP